MPQLMKTALDQQLRNGLITSSEYVRKREEVASNPDLSRKMEVVEGPVMQSGDFFSSITSPIKNAFSGAMDAVKSTVGGAFSGVADSVGGAVSSLGQGLFKFAIVLLLVLMAFLLVYSKIKKEVGA